MKQHVTLRPHTPLTPREMDQTQATTTARPVGENAVRVDVLSASYGGQHVSPYRRGLAMCHTD